MAHNGGRIQVNPHFLQTGGAFPFIDHALTSQGWSRTSDNAPPTPASLNAQGFPIAGSGVYSAFFIPSQASRPGNWIVDWLGTITSMRQNFGKTTVSGASTGTNGRWVITPTDSPSDDQIRIDLGINTWGAGDPVTRMRMYHADDEALISAGEVWSPYFKNRLIEVGAGAFRELDWALMNTSGCAKWEHRTPVNYANLGGSTYRPEYDAGTTTNSGDDYTASYPGGVLLSDKLLIHVTFNTTPTTNSPTLNTIPVKNMAGSTFSSNSPKPIVNRTWTLVYDADLNAWLGQEGGIQSGVPPELFMRLYNEVGCHGWAHTPYLACDPPTDWQQSHSEMLRDGLATGLKEIREIQNELWNTLFAGTNYAANKANIRAGWGSPTGRTAQDNWYGMVLSRLGEIISGVYGGDRSRYRFVCGVQSSLFATTFISAPRLTSALWVAEGGGHTPASDWVTDGAITTYFNTLSTTQEEIALAYQWEMGDDDERQSAIDEYAQTYDTEVAYAEWKSFFEGHGVDGLLAYEGSWSQDYLSPLNDNIAAITAVTKGNPTQITISASNGIIPVAGMWAYTGQSYRILSVAGNVLTIDVDSTGFPDDFFGNALLPCFALPITNITKAASAVITVDISGGGQVARTGWFCHCAGVEGMTEINYQFKSGTRTNTSTFTLNFNSSGFSTYTGGGYLLVNISSIRTDLREASLGSDNVRSMEYTNCHNFVDAGGEFPSLYNAAGKHNVWSALQPTIYADDSPKWLGFKLFGNRLRRVRLTATA